MTNRFAAAALFALAAIPSALAAPMSVTVSGIESTTGTLYLSVQTEAQFMQEDRVAGVIVSSPASGDRTFVFDVPEGDYAVSIYQDLDLNGAFTMGAAGPADAWGMSARGPVTGLPSFEDAKVAVGPQGADVTVQLIQPAG